MWRSAVGQEFKRAGYLKTEEVGCCYRCICDCAPSTTGVQAGRVSEDGGGEGEGPDGAAVLLGRRSRPGRRQDEHARVRLRGECRSVSGLATLGGKQPPYGHHFFN